MEKVDGELHNGIRLTAFEPPGVDISIVSLTEQQPEITERRSKYTRPPTSKAGKKKNKTGI